MTNEELSENGEKAPAQAAGPEADVAALGQPAPASSLAATIRDNAKAADSAAPSILRPKDRLGPFRIERVIGRGGMGIVYEAVEATLKRHVALKVLPPAALLDETQIRRFRNEASAAAQLTHPNIVPVYSIGSDCGVHFYAMQLIAGRNLSQVIASIREKLEQKQGNRRWSEETQDSDKTLAQTSKAPEVNTTDHRLQHPSSKRRRSSEPWLAADFALFGSNRQLVSNRTKWFKTIAGLSRDAARAIAFAHDCGVIHRDLKPSNLILDDRGKIWVTDFGLAQLRNNPIGTATGDVVGTYRYMSPEQASGRRFLIDHRTDVYSLGATLFELLALRPAFTSDDPTELMRNAAFDDPPQLRKISPLIPVELETIVCKAMAKNPHERYLTAHEMADDLDRFCQDQPIAARPPSALQRLRRWSRKYPAITGMLAVALCMCFLASLALSGTMWQFGTTMKAQYQAASALLLASRSHAMRIENPGLAVALARESVALQATSEGNRALLSSLEENHELSLLELRQAPCQLSLSADGTRVLTVPAFDGRRPSERPMVLDLVTERPLFRLEPRGVVVAAMYVPGSDRIITLSVPAELSNGDISSPSTPKLLSLWDGTTGNPLQTLSDIPISQLTEAQFSPGGQRVVLPGSEGEACVYATTNLQQEFVLRSDGNVQHTAFSPGGRWIATSDQAGTVRLWNAGDGSPSISLPRNQSKVRRLEFSHDDRYLLASTGDHTLVYSTEADRAEPIVHLVEPEFTLLPTQDRCVAYYDSANYLNVRKLSDGALVTTIPLSDMARKAGERKHIGFAGDQTMAVASGKAIEIFNCISGEKIHSLRGHQSFVRGIAYSKALDCWISCSADKTLRRWSPRSGRERMQSDNSSLTFPNIAFSPNTKEVLISQTTPPSSIFFDAKGNRIFGTIEGILPTDDFHRYHMMALEGKHLKVIDIRTGRSVFETSLAWQLSAAQAISDQAFLLVADTGQCSLWQAEEGRLTNLTLPGEIHSCSAISHDGRTLAIGLSSGKCHLYSVEQPTGPTRTLQHAHKVVAVQLLSEERVATVDSQSQCHIWDIEDSPHLLQHQGANINTLLVSHDGKYLFTYHSREESEIACWDTVTRQSLGQTEKRPLSKVLLCCNADCLIQVSRSHGVQVWGFLENESAILSDRPTVDAQLMGDTLFTIERVTPPGILHDPALTHQQSQRYSFTGFHLKTRERLFEPVLLPARIPPSLSVDNKSETIAITARSFVAKLLDLETEQSRSLGQHQAMLTHAAFLDNGTVVTAGLDGMLNLQHQHARTTSQMYEHPITAIAHHGATLACGLADGSIVLFDAASNETLTTLPGNSTAGAVHFLQFASDGKHLLATYENAGAYWNLLSRIAQPIASLTADTRAKILPGNQYAIRWKSSTAMLAGDHRNAAPGSGLQPIKRDVDIFDLASDKITNFLPDSTEVKDLEVSPDGSEVWTVGTNGELKFYRRSASSMSFAPIEHRVTELVENAEVKHLQLSPSGRLLALTVAPNAIYIFDLHQNENIYLFSAPGDLHVPVLNNRPCAFSKDEEWFAFAMNSIVAVRPIAPASHVERYTSRRLTNAERP
jgi:serine/threonine protein kinase/WD40 repeat protein